MQCILIVFHYYMRRKLAVRSDTVQPDEVHHNVPLFKSNEELVNPCDKGGSQKLTSEHSPYRRGIIKYHVSHLKISQTDCNCYTGEMANQRNYGTSLNISTWMTNCGSSSLQCLASVSYPALCPIQSQHLDPRTPQCSQHVNRTHPSVETPGYSPGSGIPRRGGQ
jgi:hypothetical protein